MTLLDLIKREAARLKKAGVSFGHGTANAFDEAAWLVLWRLGLPLDALDEHAERELTDAEAASVAALVGPQTVGVLLEPIQGEAGVIEATPAFLRDLRRMCDDLGLLLMFDEVQTGFARTGEWWGFQHAGVVPDVVTMAKAMGNGFPVGAVWARNEVAAAFVPGDHGSTYSGTAIATAVVSAVIGEIASTSEQQAQGVDQLTAGGRRHARRCFPLALREFRFAVLVGIFADAYGFTGELSYEFWPASGHESAVLVAKVLDRDHRLAGRRAGLGSRPALRARRPAAVQDGVRQADRAVLGSVGGGRDRDRPRAAQRDFGRVHRPRDELRPAV